MNDYSQNNKKCISTISSFLQCPRLQLTFQYYPNGSGMSFGISQVLQIVKFYYSIFAYKMSNVRVRLVFFPLGPSISAHKLNLKTVSKTIFV